MACTCDMFPDPHPDGFVAADGTTCEKALPGARVSPHILAAVDAVAKARAKAAPRLREDQVAAVKRTLGG